MATTVKIIYTGTVVDIVRAGSSISRIFVPNNSYVDSAVFVEGYANADAVGDEGTYGKSIYATNVEGLGALAGLAPMASTTVKFAEFEQAILAGDDGITFSIDGYEDELYWNQIAANMWQQGFYIEVGSNKYGIEPA
jgi:hypothetical protein